MTHGANVMRIEHISRSDPYIDYMIKRVNKTYYVIDKDRHYTVFDSAECQRLAQESMTSGMRIRIFTSGLSRAQTGYVDIMLRSNIGEVTRIGTVYRTMDGKSRLAGFYIIVDNTGESHE